LPLFIVLVGYHRWRRICPLAFFAQIPVRMRWPGHKTRFCLVGKELLSDHGIRFLRLALAASNSQPTARTRIFVFFILLSLAALIIGAVYTGKTWCNYICPVSFIEKIYTDRRASERPVIPNARSARPARNSVPTSTKENGYWKEIGLDSKRAVYFAFPVSSSPSIFLLSASRNVGILFRGRWTNEPGLISAAFLPGPNPASTGSFSSGRAARLAAAITLLLAR